jgi:hypothetical protein
MGAEERRLVASEQARQSLAMGDIESSLRICLEYGCSPFTGTALQMRAMLELRKGRFDEANKFIEQALRMKADQISYKIAADAAFLQCKYEQAEKNYRKTIEIVPTMHESWHDLGVAIVSQGKVHESLTYFAKAVELQPQRADYNHHLSLMLLLDGQEAAGWDRMQWRLHVPGICGTFPNPEKYWKGEPLEGKTITLRTEQGWGDTILFANYIPWLAQQAKKVYVHCQRPMVSWIEHYFPMADVWPSDAPPPLDFDYHVNIMCLPRLTTWEQAYLAPKAQNRRGEGIGINWFGSPTHKADHLRSVPIERFDQVAEAAGQKLYCLGYGRFENQPPFVEYLIDGCKDWLETSHIVKNLDLIITVDTAIAHLGGFLGVETWLLLPHVPDFRWGMTGERTKWYPSIRLYRQPKVFDWDSVFNRVAADLRARNEEDTQAVGGVITTAAAS